MEWKEDKGRVFAEGLRACAYNAGINEGVLEVAVACEELLVEERSVLDVAEERSVDGVTGRQMLEVDALQRHGDRPACFGDSVARIGAGVRVGRGSQRSPVQ